MDKQDIKTILDQIAEMNINKCASTTYDLSVQECTRYEIVKGLASLYDVKYNFQPKGVKIFPVKSTD
jgi:hypothetical protein